MEEEEAGPTVRRIRSAKAATKVSPVVKQVKHKPGPLSRRTRKKVVLMEVEVSDEDEETSQEDKSSTDAAEEEKKMEEKLLESPDESNVSVEQKNVTTAGKRKDRTDNDSDEEKNELTGNGRNSKSIKLDDSITVGRRNKITFSMAIPNWSPKSPKWSSESYTLLIESNVDKIPQQRIEDIIKKSKDFPIEFPIDTGRCKILKKLAGEKTLTRNINSVYPIIHENALELYCKFILFKRKYGTAKEKNLYREMTLKTFINRLFVKRAVMFIGVPDKYLLLNKECGRGAWETIGTDEESPPLIIKECLTYDEIKLSVFLSVSSYTYFVNDGSRVNLGKESKNRDNIANEGIIIGVIGPRLKKRGVMEYQEIVSSEDQNTEHNGYGTKVNASIHKLFSEFYEESCLDLEETLKLRSTEERRYTNLAGGLIFDNHYYCKRLTISIDTLLIEGNFRAEAVEKTAYIHVVGLGLGVWRISIHQEQLFMETFARRILALANNLHSVSDICFSYINKETCGGYKNGEVFKLQDHPFGGIKIHILKRNPHEKIAEDKLLVVSYAWDGNALPGNEYWCGKLRSSSDSAAASSTQIAELHNPFINPLVCADELRVIKNNQVVSFKEYQNSIKQSKGT